MKLATLIAISTAALVAATAPAHAQSVAAANLQPGGIVFGPQGNEVGKIESISGEAVVINTGTHRATLMGAHFAKGEKGPRIGYTRTQLEQAVDAAQQATKAKVEAALVVGNPLRSSDGVALGSIKSLNEDGSVVIEGTDRTFALQRDAFATDEKGLIILFTAEKLSEALNKSTTSSAQEDTASPAS